MKRAAKWIAISVVVLAILCIGYSLYSKISFSMMIKKVDFQTVNKYFHTQVPDNSYIDKYKVESDIDSSYCLSVKLNMLINEADKILSFFKEYQKEKNDGDYRWPPFLEWGLNKANYDYTITRMTDVKKSLFLGEGGSETQRSMYIIVTKPQDGKISVYMMVGKVGGGWKELKGYHD